MFWYSGPPLIKFLPTALKETTVHHDEESNINQSATANCSFHLLQFMQDVLNQTVYTELLSSNVENDYE